MRVPLETRNDICQNSPRKKQSTMTVNESTAPAPSDQPAPIHRRRPRYSGKYPRKFTEKYKEHSPERYAETVAKVLASGKTPAGTHRPIMVEEVLQALAPVPGDLAVDCTLGYGGHTTAILEKIVPGGRLLGLDADPLELPRTESRLRAAGFGPEVLQVLRSNFAGLPKALQQVEFPHANVILADLGVSSMQLDDPARGFTSKFAGPLDMRMNPDRGQPASRLVEKASVETLATLFEENADEPRARLLAERLAGKTFATTTELAFTVRGAMPGVDQETRELTVRRVFQALRIAVNEEFSALENLLRQLPSALAPGGRVAILTFHSGEDRRVKKHFAAGLASGIYSEISPEVLRASPDERQANPRSSSAKLRWARRAEATEIG